MYRSSVLNQAAADPGYVLSFLTHPAIKHYIESFNAGGSRRAITKGHIESFQIPLPPLSEQRAIANVLEALDRKIQLNWRMDENLEAMARAIFKSWFVDFDPVRAKAEGRQPSGTDAATAALFPDSFEDSSLGQIPKGWRVGKFAELASLSRESVNPNAFPDEVFHHYSIPAFDEGRWPKQETGAQIKSNKFLVPPNSVLVSKLNPRFPRVWLPAIADGERSIASTEFLVALARPPFSREYLFGLFTSESFFEVFGTLVTGTSSSHQRVRPEFLQEMDAVIPPKDCIASFSRIVGPLYAKVKLSLTESHTVSAIRDALLPKLISGDIRVVNFDEGA
jgi:type I restriction enzyme, S subunit